MDPACRKGCATDENDVSAAEMPRDPPTAHDNISADEGRETHTLPTDIRLPAWDEPEVEEDRETHTLPTNMQLPAWDELEALIGQTAKEIAELEGREKHLREPSY